MIKLFFQDDVYWRIRDPLTWTLLSLPHLYAMWNIIAELEVGRQEGVPGLFQLSYCLAFLPIQAHSVLSTLSLLKSHLINEAFSEPLTQIQTCLTTPYSALCCSVESGIIWQQFFHLFTCRWPLESKPCGGRDLVSFTAPSLRTPPDIQ